MRFTPRPPNRDLAFETEAIEASCMYLGEETG